MAAKGCPQRGGGRHLWLHLHHIEPEGRDAQHVGPAVAFNDGARLQAGVAHEGRLQELARLLARERLCRRKVIGFWLQRDGGGARQAHARHLHHGAVRHAQRVQHGVGHDDGVAVRARELRHAHVHGVTQY